MGGEVHDGIGELPNGIGLYPHATVPARAGHGGGTVELARRPFGGIVRILRRLSEPPECRREAAGGLRRVGSASFEAMDGGVHDGIGALPDGVGLCPLANVPARNGNGGGTVRILRTLSEPPGGRREVKF